MGGFLFMSCYLLQNYDVYIVKTELNSYFASGSNIHTPKNRLLC